MSESSVVLGSAVARVDNYFSFTMNGGWSGPPMRGQLFQMPIRLKGHV
jgi:hypothetical protein